MPALIFKEHQSFPEIGAYLLEFPVAVARFKIIDPSPKHRIELKSQFTDILYPLFIMGKTPDFGSDSLHALLGRPAVEEVLALESDRRSFPDIPAKEVKSLSAHGQIDPLGFLRMKLET